MSSEKKIPVGIAIIAPDDVEVVDVLAALAGAFEKVCKVAGLDPAEMFALASQAAKPVAPPTRPAPSVNARGGCS